MMKDKELQNSFYFLIITLVGGVNVITYAVLAKKTYQDLTTSLEVDVYEAIKVLDNADEANETREQYEAYCGMLVNKIDSNGIFKYVDTKVVALEGKYTLDQVSTMLRVAKDFVWNRGRKKL